MADIQRIGVGNSRYPSIDENQGILEPGYFTFDSTTVRFDSTVDTFDFDVVIVPPVIKRDYKEGDYLNPDYK